MESLKWAKIEAFEWTNSMKTCPQDSIYHTEGDVWTHTCMVVSELLQDLDFQQLNAHEQYILFLKAQIGYTCGCFGRMIRQLDMPLLQEVHEVMYVRNYLPF